MSDLIDRQALLKQIDIDSDGEPGYYGDTWKFIDTIKSMPNVHDLPKDADTISRQAAIDAVHKNYDTILDFKSDGRTVAGSFEDIINALPPVGKCFVAEDIIKWLLLYHAQAIKLMGRYRPSEVITWVINDMTKTLFNEGERYE